MDRVGLPAIAAGSYWEVGTAGAVVVLAPVAGAPAPEPESVAGAVVVPPAGAAVPLR